MKTQRFTVFAGISRQPQKQQQQNNREANAITSNEHNRIYRCTFGVCYRSFCGGFCEMLLLCLLSSFFWDFFIVSINVLCTLSRHHMYIYLWMLSAFSYLVAFECSRVTLRAFALLMMSERSTNMSPEETLCNTSILFKRTTMWMNEWITLFGMSVRWRLHWMRVHNKHNNLLNFIPLSSNDRCNSNLTNWYIYGAI